MQAKQALACIMTGCDNLLAAEPGVDDKVYTAGKSQWTACPVAAEWRKLDPCFRSLQNTPDIKEHRKLARGICL